MVGETAILRDHGKLEVSRGPELPKDLSKLARLDLLDVWSLPFRAQELTDSKNSGYRLVSSDLTETLYFSNVPARIESQKLKPRRSSTQSFAGRT